MKYQVVHNNVFSFEKEVYSCQLEAKLHLVENAHQSISFKQLQIRPFGAKKSESKDEFGNLQSTIDFNKQINSLRVSSIHTVNTVKLDRDFSKSILYVDAKDQVDEKSQLFVASTHLTQSNESIHAYAKQFFNDKRSVYEGTLDLMQKIYNDFRFDVNISTIKSTAIDCWNNQAGVCQDFSHFAIACLKSVGLIARYVSGYVDTKVDDNKIYIPGRDVSHAWFSVYDANLGWIDFDPTNNMLVEDRHIIMAYGKDYDDICPLKGKLDTKGSNSLKVSVDVSKV